jgi:hypothetical protein
VTHFVALDRLPIEFCDACPIDALPYSELTMHPQGSRGNWGLGSPALDAEGDDGGFGSALDGWLKTPGVQHPWCVACGVLRAQCTWRVEFPGAWRVEFCVHNVLLPHHVLGICQNNRNQGQRSSNVSIVKYAMPKTQITTMLQTCAK